jgi:hypothetical protein
MDSVQEDVVYLKNSSLMGLVGKHVIVGWGRDNKWQAGVLQLVAPTKDTVKDAKEALARPFLWKLDMTDRPGNRVQGYERVKEVFFVTTDIEWWCPATPKEPEHKHLNEAH